MENLAVHWRRPLEVRNAAYVLVEDDGGSLVVRFDLTVAHVPSGHSKGIDVPSAVHGLERRADKHAILTIHKGSLDASILVVLATGELILYVDESSVAERRLVGEVVGSFPAGIVNASVSPDGELLVLVTGDGQLIIMSRSSLFPLHEASLQSLSASYTDRSISVGWGKKETQFHGSAGKQAALARIEIKEQRLKDDLDDEHIRISWRSDGSYFAVSFLQAGSHRQILVMDRDGVVVSVKEPTAGLGPAMSWRRDGSLIAASHHRPDGLQGVIFYERNGLRHGEFYLAERDETIRDLLWNANGTILAMILHDGRVYLWTCSNYHWYLKYCLPGKCHRLLWSDTDPMTFHYLTSWGGAVQYELVRRLDRSSMGADDPYSLVAVVDGRTLHLTPFALANVPPPLSFAQIPLENIPNCVAVYCAADGARVAVASPAGNVTIYLVGMHDDQLQWAEISLFSTRVNLKQIVFQDVETIFCLPDDGLQMQLGADVVTKRNVFSYHARMGKLLYLDDGGNVYADDTGAPLLRNTRLGIQTDFFLAHDQIHVLTRTRDNLLLLNDVEMMRDCTSFLVHREFLCVTDPAGVVRFYPLDQDPAEWSSISTAGEEFARSSEEGALCVATVARDASLVLQMPRGNLETIFPRAFVLSQVRRHLNKLDYRDAFLLCRRQRVDLNIIHDNNPELFVATLGRFVQEVVEVEHLNLFLSSLRAENVKATRYRAFIKESPEPVPTYPDKVNTICDKIRDILLTTDAHKYAESIMTAYVCRQPPNHRAALAAIVDLSASSSAEAVERALKYLLFLVPAEHLYRVALGMYNLPLALSVARRSQMDPAEYNQFLESLHSLEDERRRRFQIDDFLQHYPSALRHLAESGAALGECLDYIRRHDLFVAAFKLYEERDPQEWRLLCLHYAEHLIAKDPLSEAAIDLFIFANENDRACEQAIKTGAWKKALSSCPRPHMSSIVERLIHTLMEQQRYAEALRVAERHSEPQTALKVAIAGQLWTEALCIAQCRGLVRDQLRDAAIAHQAHVLEELGELEATFDEKSARLELLQTQLIDALDPAKIQASLENITGEAEIADSMSQLSLCTGTTLAGSQRSVVLSHASSSTRSKKKADRKRMRGKPGSPYEREYLRDLVKETIQRVLYLQRSSLDLVQYFGGERMFKEARAVQDRMARLVEKIKTVCGRLARLVAVQEEKMGPQVLAALGLSPFTIPPILQITHEWRTAFDLPLGLDSFQLEYLRCL